MGYTQIPMYTLSQDFNRISGVAFEELVRLMEGNTGRHVTVEFEVVKLLYEEVIH